MSPTSSSLAKQGTTSTCERDGIAGHMLCPRATNRTDCPDLNSSMIIRADEDEFLR